MNQDNGNPIVRFHLWVESHRKVGAHNPYHRHETEIVKAIFSVNNICAEDVASRMSYRYEVSRMMTVQMYKRDYDILSASTDLAWGSDYTITKIGKVHNVTEAVILASRVEVLAK